MKRIIALLITLVLVFALASCASVKIKRSTEPIPKNRRRPKYRPRPKLSQRPSLRRKKYLHSRRPTTRSKTFLKMIHTFSTGL